MGKGLSDGEIADYRRDGFLFPLDTFGDYAVTARRWRRAWLLALLASVVAGCVAVDTRPRQNSQAPPPFGDLPIGGADGM